jgi:phosphohistidine phosphatase
MKTLLLIRHAKSSWDNVGLDDFARPLNARGKKEAPMMARRLLDKKIKIDEFISSPAKRARKTATAFMNEFKEKKGKILLVKELYMASDQSFINTIKNVKNKFDRIAIFSHNPGITEYANSLTDTKIDDMPTCSVFAVKADIKKWNEFKEAKKEFWFFDYPKAGSEQDGESGVASRES